jgi:HEAT repeat protein
MLVMLAGNDLALNSGRKAFSFPDGEVIKDLTNISATLSYEFFIRRIQKITFLRDLKEEDLLDFLRILNLPPEDVQKSGGVEKLLTEHGVQTIWVNEFDLSIINARREDMSSAGKSPPTLEEVESGLGMEWAEETEQVDDNLADLNPEEELQVLLKRLATTVDDDLYLMAVRQATTCCDIFKSRNDLEAFYPLLELLAAHANDPARKSTIRDCARFGLEQLSIGDELLVFLLDRTESANVLSNETLLAVLSATGPTGIGLTVTKMGSTDNLAVRKQLTSLLVGLGGTAVPVLLKMMRDNRWYMVRNLAAILGDIGLPEAVPELLQCLRHTDNRVSKEAIRSLAKIGGREAEAAIIGILNSNNPQLLPQVIASLGGMKSRRALVELMLIVSSSDMFLKNLSLKIDALAAVAMIGDRQAVPPLTRLLASRHLFARARWEQLKIAVAVCLGRLGDPRALPVLNKFASDVGELGKVCAEAVETIERTRGEQNGGA